MTGPLVFEFPLSRETRVYVEIDGKVPNRAGFRLMVTLLDAMTAALDSSEAIPEIKHAADSNGFRRFIDPVLSAEITQLFTAKQTIADIARVTKFSAQTISNHLCKLGLHQPKGRVK